MQRHGNGTIIDLTESESTHVPDELSLSYDLEANSLESSSYADKGSYEYTYAGADAMTAGVPTMESGSRINILCYRVFSLGVKPYIMFGLRNDVGGLSLIDTNMPSLDRFSNCITDIGKKFGINETVYTGYLRHGSNTILCVEDAVPEQNVCASEIPDIQWALSTEIINDSRVLGNAVDPRVVELFEAFPSLLFLYDELGNLYESPEVGFCGTSRRRAASMYVLGAPRDEPSSDTGPYYRFLDYEGGVNQAKEQGENDDMVLTRFALFLGRTTMSAISGNWGSYDSLRTPDGTICVRDYNQQIPISSHSLPRV